MPVDRVGDPVGDQGRYAEAVETLEPPGVDGE
jgi:hypothetical protein